MRILFLGDIVGRSGRLAVVDVLPSLIEDWKLDFVGINGENSAGGFGITEACRNYLQPLIAGEDYPPYVDGLPAYVSLKNESAARMLPPFAG